MALVTTIKMKFALVCKGLHLLFLSNFPGATFIQGATFIPDSRVDTRMIIDQVSCLLFT